MRFTITLILAQSAPKGHHIPAQGTALRSIVKDNPSPEGATHQSRRHEPVDHLSLGGDGRGEVRIKRCEFRSSVSSTFRIRHSSFPAPSPPAPSVSCRPPVRECVPVRRGWGEVRMQKSELRSSVSSTFESRHSPFARSHAMPCFSNITDMAWAVSKVGFP